MQVNEKYEMTLEGNPLVAGGYGKARVIAKITKVTPYACNYEVLEVLSITEHGFPNGAPKVGGFSLVHPYTMASKELKKV